ncbi:MAG: cell division protein ZapA, partial [Oscillospiraceae bacterium]|nr:cell division protein ZapA [Oscillospiraceae bacterium]
FKEQEASVDLRRQIKDLMEENARLKTELSESKREIFKLQQKR